MKRTSIALGAVIACLVALALPAARPVGAQTSGDGELNPGSVRAGAWDLGAGTYPGGGLPARQPSTAPPFVWHRATYAQICVVFSGPPPDDLPGGVDPMPGPSRGFPLRPGAAVGVPPGTVLISSLVPLPADARVVGTFVVDVGDDPAVWGDILLVPRCVQPGEPLPEAPPTAAEIWQETPLPRTQIHASPPGTFEWPGITRLRTDFRGVALGPATASVSLHGFDVVVVAEPIAYAWAFGDGTNVVTADPSWPTGVAYLRRGDFTVRLYVVWEGRAQLRSFGFDLGVRDLGTVTIPEQIPYHVAEIRALLHVGRGRR